MRYGLPYQGSKNKIAKDIILFIKDFLNKDNILNDQEQTILYDVFGGGGAITHCAIDLKAFKKVVYNEYNTELVNLFKNAINGDYKNSTEWISREDFKQRKNDLFIALFWSFSNNCQRYLYSEEIEPYKKALHFARLFNDFSLFENMGIKFLNGDASRANIKKHSKEISKIYIEWYVNTVLNIKMSSDEISLKIQNLKDEIKENKQYLQSYLRDALKKSGLKVAEVSRHLNNSMAKHYFANSQWLFPTYNEYQKLQEILPLYKDYYELTERTELNNCLKNLQSLESLESLERLQRLEHLQSLQGLKNCSKSLKGRETLPELPNLCRQERGQDFKQLQDYTKLEIYNKSYNELEINQGVIYCDPPYKNTSGYEHLTNNTFNYDEFYLWCEQQKQPCFISEFDMPTDRFLCVWSKKRQNNMCGSKARNICIEKLFIPISQIKKGIIKL